MTVTSDAIRTQLGRTFEEAGIREALVVGNLSTIARKYLESKGTRIVEQDELIYLTLPGGAEVGRWNYDEGHHVPSWAITFDDEGDPKACHVILEVEPIAFESRMYVLPI